MPVTVVIVDDEPLVRVGLRAILEAQPDIEVIGEAADGAAVVPLVRQLRPDVVVMDVRMPLLNGIDATRAVLRAVQNPPKIIVITTFENDEYVYRALRTVANGFLLKRSRPGEIVHGVRLVMAGDSLLFPAALRTLAAEYGNSSRPGGDGSSPPHPPRGLDPPADGPQDVQRDIAAQLTIGTEKVKSHVSAVLGKLRARDRAQAVIAAYESGFVTPNE